MTSINLYACFINHYLIFDKETSWVFINQTNLAQAYKSWGEATNLWDVIFQKNCYAVFWMAWVKNEYSLKQKKITKITKWN